MKTLILLLSLLAALPISLTAADTATPSREAIEWCDIWISHANETNLPRVLLIGDSITRDYYPGVEKHLAGKAFVARLTTSRFLAEPAAEEIELVLEQMRFDVIHFNNGMHGWQHSELEYQKAFPVVLETIKSHAPKARLIWAATTPIRDSKGVSVDAKLECSNERIAARNAIAAAIVTAQDIPTDDLNLAMRGHDEYHSDNVHFVSRGVQVQAAQVAAAIEPLLPP